MPEFPVFGDGTYLLKAELLKNGESVDSEEFTLSYIESVSAGYKNRGFNTHFSHFTHDERDTSLLRAIGANTYRDAFYWGTTDIGGFKYNFSKYDSSFGSIINTDMEMVCCLIASHWETDDLDFDENDRDIIQFLKNRNVIVLLNKSDLSGVITEEKLLKVIFGEKASILSPFGDLFINLLMIIIVPLIFLTIISFYMYT